MEFFADRCKRLRLEVADDIRRSGTRASRRQTSKRRLRRRCYSPQQMAFDAAGGAASTQMVGLPQHFQPPVSVFGRNGKPSEGGQGKVVPVADSAVGADCQAL
jgi:hypothetical protein